MALPTRDQWHSYLRYEGIQYIYADIAVFEMRLARIYRREVHRVQVHDLILGFFNTFWFGEAVFDLDMPGALQFQLGGVWRHPQQAGFECLLDWDLVCRGFSGYTPSYTLIRDLMLRLCHKLITSSIAGRSQAPEKIFEIIYLWEEAGEMISEGPARKEGDARGVDEEALAALGGGDEDEDMPQAVPPPPRTQGKRIARLEEEVHGMCEALQGQREVLDIMDCDFSRFTTWTITSLTRFMDKAVYITRDIRSDR
uniref:Uncharacterized protein n=1 Tax=Tanacetum cinerariifolium TaxID=118510 RepID=A0A6L2LLD2_TANCI|nr:hypothetical protein [Tanacetum cinerariifolium]